MNDKYCCAWRGLVASIILICCQGALAVGMGLNDARHLLTRTGFGATPDELQRYAVLSHAEAVNMIVDGTRSIALTPLPERVLNSPIKPQRDMTQAERQAYDMDQRLRTNEMRAWWIGEMLATPSPLTERMTLFWHNHFVSSQPKVKHLALMRDQNLLLRSHATGNFAALLHAVSKDPAMIIYLDGASNRKGKPNENFAREVMELFTLGEGNYSEADIKEAARAFTGWSYNAEDGRFVFRRALHDTGDKRIFEQHGRFDGDDVLDLLLSRPATARHIVAKLWREFISPQAEAAEVERLAVLFREQGYAIKPVLRALLLSDAFWSEAARGALVKSPVDLVVGSLHSLQAEVPDAIPLTRSLRVLGQDLLAPPNVRGWPGQEVWINTAALLTRKQFLDRLARADDLGRVPPATLAMAADSMNAAPAAQMAQRVATAVGEMRFSSPWAAGGDAHGMTPTEVLLAVPAVDAATGKLALRAVLLDPAYQVK